MKKQDLLSSQPENKEATRKTLPPTLTHLQKGAIEGHTRRNTRKTTRKGTCEKNSTDKAFANDEIWHKQFVTSMRTGETRKRRQTPVKRVCSQRRVQQWQGKSRTAARVHQTQKRVQTVVFQRSVMAKPAVQTVGVNVTLEGLNHSICGTTRTSKKVACTSMEPDLNEARDRLKHKRQSLTQYLRFSQVWQIHRFYHVGCKLWLGEIHMEIF